MNPAITQVISNLTQQITEKNELIEHYDRLIQNEMAEKEKIRSLIEELRKMK
jgi:restriction endonuclease S subunit